MSEHHYTLARTVRRFGPMLRAQWRRVAAIVTFSLIASGLAVLAPVPVKLVIDGVLAGKAPDWMPPVSTGAMVILLAVGAAVLASATALFSAMEKRLSARAREEMTRHMRLCCLDRFLQLTPLCLGKDRQGELSLRLIDDSQQVARLFTKTGPAILRHLLVFVMTLVAMAWVDPGLAGLALGLCAMLAAMMRLSAAQLGATARAKRKQEGRVAASSQELLRVLPFIQSSGIETVMRTRFDAVSRAALASGVDETLAAVKLERRMHLATGLAQAVIVGAGGLLALRGTITAGDLAIAVLYLNQMLKPLEKINELASAVTGATSRAGRLAEMLDRPDPLDRTGRHVALIATPTIDLEQASFAWPGGARIDYGTLTIPHGSIVCVSGPSGAGKSTLLALLTRLIDARGGELRLDGVAYRDWDIAALRRHFAIAPQSPPLLAGNVREWLMLGDEHPDEACCWAALDAVSLGDAVRAKGGLDASLGESGTGFSGGEQARLSVARALLARRPILLLDEPLANVDAGSARIILAALAQERGKRTVLIISHQPLPNWLVDIEIAVEAGAVVHARRCAVVGMAR